MTTAAPTWRGLRLDPLDVLFFRDGRPFDAASRVSGGLPNPQTLGGALRTALLARTEFDFRTFSGALRQEYEEARKQPRPPSIKAALRHGQRNAGGQGWIIEARFRGPWLALARKNQLIEPLFPLPATLARKERPIEQEPPPATPPLTKGSDWLRAEPRDASALPGWENDKGLLPLWRKGKPDTKAGGGFLTLTGVRAFLANRDFAESEFFTSGDLYDFDNRTGIGIDMQTLTSAEGEIYGIRLLSLKPTVGERPKINDDPYRGAAVCFYAEVLPGEGMPDLKPYLIEPIPFGGEGKYVRATAVDPCVWPPADARLQQSLWYLATPAFFGTSSGLPRLRSNLALRAAASGAGTAVSGWDIARNGPRPTRFAVPAGAVYFVEGPVPADGPFDLDKDEAVEGWGFALQGTWEGRRT